MAIKVKYSRTTDKFVSLGQRVKMANNANADVFVSIHVNSATSSARGFEVFSHRGSVRGKRLATSVYDAVIKNKSLYASARGLKTANFYVLRHTRMAAVLVETAFISNPHDAKILKTKQKEFAKQIAEGIKKEVGSNATVFLDAGHGGKDPGATGNGIREKDIALAITLEVGRQLTQKPKRKEGSCLKYGDKGPRVTKLQNDLKKLNYDIIVGGAYGKDTEAAVTRFQANQKGVKRDGIACETTLRMIENYINNLHIICR